MADDEQRSDDESTETDQQVTAPGEWENQPSDEGDRRHDDSTAPLPKPLGDDADDDVAEQEAGDLSEDENVGPPEQKEVGDAGRRLEESAKPLLQGPDVAGVPTRSIVGIAALILVFCVAFFALWALIDGAMGVLIGIIAGTALGLGAMKLLADRQ